MSKFGINIDQPYDADRWRDLSWIVTGRFAGDMGYAAIALDASGNPMCDLDARERNDEFARSMLFDNARLNQMIDSTGITKELWARFVFGMTMHICCIASSFMSCKNVQLVERQSPRHERRQREREKKPPLTKYYTLNIEPMKKILRVEGKSEEVGLKKAMHICRGHFAYYTPDKPLFGKLSGRFWIPAHVRGSKDLGEIKKDYRVVLSQ